jgi:hypothetical protein
MAQALVFLGEVADEGDFGANVVVELNGFGLVDGLLHHKFVHQPTNKAVIVQIEKVAALRAVYEGPQVAQKMGIHGNT